MRRWVGALLFVAALAVVVPAEAVKKLPKQTVLGMQTRSGGEYSFSPVTVQTGVIALQLLIDLTEAGTGSLPTMSASLEGSRDGGNTWKPAGAFSRPAGPKVNDKQGVLQTEIGGMFWGDAFWRDSTNAQRRLRGKANLGGTLRFALTATAITP